ncbi:hypothetical protein THAOC_21041, partial [Thalassiosira oceanica]
MPVRSGSFLMNFFPARPARSRDRHAEVELYRTIASRATDRPTESLTPSPPSRQRTSSQIERPLPLDHPLRQGEGPSESAIFSFRRRRRPAKVTRDSGKTARDWVASTSEPTNQRPTMHRWLFEVDGGHGPTQWTRRRVEGTRPNRIDPVVAPNTARVSEKVTQKKVHLF